MNLEHVILIFLWLYFVFNGVNHFLHLSELNKEYHHKRTFETKNLIILSWIVLILGWLSFIFEFEVFWWALAIMIFMISVTPVVHTFWKWTKHEKWQELAHFTKNIAIVLELANIMLHYGIK